MLPLSLPFCVLRVGLRAREKVYLPAFAGSKLEGAFGHALYNLSCTQTHRETCVGCPLRGICPYGLSYMPALPAAVQAATLATPPRPVIFRVPFAEETCLYPAEQLTFGFVVVGQALHQLPYLLAALREMGEQGLGRTRGRLALAEVLSVHPYTGEQVTLMRGGEPSVNLAPILLEAQHLPPIEGRHIRLDLLSPLHLRDQGKMQQSIPFSLLVRSLQRRISNLEQVHGGQHSLGANFSALPALAEQVQTKEQQLRPAVQLRKGSRRGEKTAMEGLLGSIEYVGDFAPFAPLLRLGEQLGVGKWAHFGGGLYDLRVLS